MPIFTTPGFEEFYWEFLPVQRGSNILIVLHKGKIYAIERYRGKRINLLIEKFLTKKLRSQ